MAAVVVAAMMVVAVMLAALVVAMAVVALAFVAMPVGTAMRIVEAEAKAMVVAESDLWLSQVVRADERLMVSPQCMPRT